MATTYLFILLPLIISVVFYWHSMSGHIAGVNWTLGQSKGALETPVLKEDTRFSPIRFLQNVWQLTRNPWVTVKQMLEGQNIRITVATLLVSLTLAEVIPQFAVVRLFISSPIATIKWLGIESVWGLLFNIMAWVISSLLIQFLTGHKVKAKAWTIAGYALAPILIFTACEAVFLTLGVNLWRPISSALVSLTFLIGVACF